MASGSSSRKSVSRGKGVMHDEQNYFDTDTYHKFVQRQSYVDDTYPNLPLIIYEPTSTNPLESQYQNQPSHFEIPNDGADQDMQDTHKKFDLFKVNLKSLFFSSYDEYLKFYSPNLNLNIQ